MARAVASNFERRASYEPLYDFDPRTEASVEVFYADQVLAKSFDTRPGWFWWTCRPAVQQAGSALCRGPVHLPDGASADHAQPREAHMARGVTLGADPHPNDEPTYDIGPKTGVRKAERPVHAVEGCSARNRTSTTHAWNVPYRALYDRTYRVLYDAGINEKLADELATERTLAVALRSCEQQFQPQQGTTLDDF